MNPLKAMAKAIWLEGDEQIIPWEHATPESQSLCLQLARAARDALADNVSEKMRNALEDRRHDLAAAIRAAGEDK
jgi:hypothetical protein